MAKYDGHPAGHAGNDLLEGEGDPSAGHTDGHGQSTQAVLENDGQKKMTTKYPKMVTSLRTR